MSNTYDQDVVRAEKAEKAGPKTLGGLPVAPKGTIKTVDTTKLPQSRLRDKPKES